MPDPASAAASAPHLGETTGAAIAAVIIGALGFQPAHVAAGMAAAGLGMIFAREMPKSYFALVWACSTLCADLLGVGAADLIRAAWLPSLPPTATGICIFVAGIAMHPLIRWIGKRVGDVGDAGLRRVGMLDEKETP